MWSRPAVPCSTPKAKGTMAMADTLPTVKVSDGHGGFIVINEEDFDPKVHKKYSEPKDAKGKPSAEGKE